MAFSAAAALKLDFVMHLADIVRPLLCSLGFDPVSDTTNCPPMQ